MAFNKMNNVASTHSSSDRHLTVTSFLPFGVTKNGDSVTDDIFTLIKHLFHHYINWRSSLTGSQPQNQGNVRLSLPLEDQVAEVKILGQCSPQGQGRQDYLAAKMGLGFKVGTTAVNLAMAILVLLVVDPRIVLGLGESATMPNDKIVSGANSSAITTANISATVWDIVTLECPALGNYVGVNEREVMWVTPDQQVLLSSPSVLTNALSTDLRCNSSDNESSSLSSPSPWHPQLSVYDASDPRLWLSSNGSLTVEDFGWSDRGRYQCVVFTQTNDEVDGNQDTDEGVGQVNVSLEVDYRKHIYYFSLMYGAVSATGFLLLTLLCRLVYWLLETYGCCLCCCCCKNQLPPKAKKIKVAMESIDAYKAQQLDKLKDNYTQQSEWIRQNCAAQMERVRENYNGQVQSLKDFKQYGTTQIQAVREQYYEQMNRIRDYSSGQLDRVHENYIFQRQRLRKFSAQNYLKVQATGKYTRKTLNRVMGHLPPLYLDLSNCRQGLQAASRQDSMHFPDFQIGELEPFDPANFDDFSEEVFRQKLRRGIEDGNENDSSLYYTPRDTPQREVAMEVVINKTSSLKNTPNREATALVGNSEETHTSHSHKPAFKTHKKSKSLGSYMPHKWLFNSSETQPLNPDPPKVNGNAPSGHQRTVRAIIEHVTSNGSSDYLDEASNIQPIEVRDKRKQSSEEIAKVDDVDITVVESELVEDDLDNVQPAPLAVTDEVVLSSSDGEEDVEEEVLTVITETKMEENQVCEVEKCGGVETDPLLKSCRYSGDDGSPV